MHITDHISERKIRNFRVSIFITICAVIFLIWVGGVVRMSGAGMGCPDWPKCFGLWIPPTDVGQLPANYQEIYKDRGYADTTFNAFHTWVEYINRLIGAVIGLLGLISVVIGFPLRHSDYKDSFYLSLLGLGAIIVQGGIGAYVVRTNLHTGMISLHMVIALTILAILLYSFLRINRFSIVEEFPQVPSNIRQAFTVASILTLLVVIQILFGTQVREQVDEISKSFGGENRDLWINELGQIYNVHKYFYYTIVGGLILLTIIMKKWMNSRLIKGLILFIWMCVGAEIILGLSMHHLSIPLWAQPMHLVFATLIFGASFYLIGILGILKKEKIY